MDDVDGTITYGKITYGRWEEPLQATFCTDGKEDFLWMQWISGIVSHVSGLSGSCQNIFWQQPDKLWLVWRKFLARLATFL